MIIVCGYLKGEDGGASLMAGLVGCSIVLSYDKVKLVNEQKGIMISMRRCGRETPYPRGMRFD